MNKTSDQLELGDILVISEDNGTESHEEIRSILNTGDGLFFITTDKTNEGYGAHIDETWEVRN